MKKIVPSEIKLKIINDRKNGISFGKIAKKFKLSKSTVQGIVDSHGIIKKKRGPKEKLNKNDIRRIKSHVENNFKLGIRTTSTEIMANFNLKVSKQTVCRTLKYFNYKYGIPQTQVTLGLNYRRMRINAAKDYICRKIDWNKVIFSDEKRFNLNGCDSFYSWHNKGSKRRSLKTILKSPGIMLWGMILPNGTFSYRIMYGKQNSSKYIDILKETLIPIRKLNMDSDFIFQQDNCPIHKSKETQNFFKKDGITVLSWPPYSPDINIIENVWPMLANQIYREKKPKNIKELIFKIKVAAAELNETGREKIKNLYASMDTRICSLLESNGRRLKY